MKGREFLEKMELVDPIYVEEAGRSPVIRHKRWPGFVAAAACLCLIAWGAWGLSGGPGQSGPVAGTMGTPYVVASSGQIRTTRPPDESLDMADDRQSLEPCHGILGLEECWVRREGTEDAANWWYYVPSGNGKYKLVVESWWNAKCAAPYEVDLDGDGVEELIFNLVYEDGLREVQVVRSRDGTLEEGYFDNAFLCSLWDGHGVTLVPNSFQSSYRSWYEPERGFVVEHSGLDADGKAVLTVDVFQDLEHFKFHACSITGETFYKPDISEQPSQPSDAPSDDVASIAPEPCPDTLGFEDCVVELREGPPGFKIWYYYTRAAEALVCIGEACSYEDRPDVYRVDLDGDGIEELICNNTYGDTVEGVRIYRNHDGMVEEGFLDGNYWNETGFEMMGAATSRTIRYDPEQGFVATGFDLTGELKEEVFQGLEHFVFQQYIHTIVPLGTAAVQADD